tara:strand:- start:113 stop:391 length:279 start_codon:yes stop_codon:yes gene_type:complete
MSKEDYEAIARIIEDVLGKDTLTCVKLLEGIKFYFDNKVEQVKVVRTEALGNLSLNIVNQHSQEADKAMKRFTARLKKENAKYRKQNCTTSS